MSKTELSAPPIEAMCFVHNWLYENGEASMWPAENVRDAARILEAYQAKAWQPIETAPKAIEWRSGIHEYGPYFLAWPVFGDVARVRWWQSGEGKDMACNFIADGGLAAHFTHWMPLPEPPVSQS